MAELAAQGETASTANATFGLAVEPYETLPVYSEIVSFGVFSMPRTFPVTAEPA